MKIIQFIKKLNATELGMGSTHETYILVPTDINIDDIFEKENENILFTSKVNKKEYKIRVTKGRETRVVGLGPFYRDFKVLPGSVIIIEKKVNNTNSEYFIDVQNFNNYALFKKFKNGFELIYSTYEENDILIERKIGNNDISITVKDEIKKRSDSPNKTKIYEIKINNVMIFDDVEMLEIDFENAFISKNYNILCNKYTYETRN
jgi:hypothetical protein